MLVILIILGIILISYGFAKVKGTNSLKAKIKNEFDNSIPYTKTDLELVKIYYKNLNKSNTLSNLTFSDINLDLIYKYKFNLQSFIGMTVLYKILKEPLFNLDELNNRETLIKFFLKDQNSRLKVQYIIRTYLGRKNLIIDINENTKGNLKAKYKFFKIYRWLFIITLIIIPILSYLTNINYLLFLILGEFIFIVIFNVLFNSSFKNKMSQANHLYIINLIKCAKKIKSLNIKVLNYKYREIDSNLKPFKNISRKIPISNFATSTDYISRILKLLRGLFLNDIIDDLEIIYTILNNKDAYSYVYNYIGEIDSLIGVAFFRNSLPYYSLPIYTNRKTLEVSNIYNPLVDNCISNSLDIEKSIIITGSNASGKSTFLRTIGLNIILGQTINTVCSESFKAPLCKLVTSISLNDSLFKGDSFYITEIKTLKEMLMSLNKDVLSIFLIDEILKGTDTLDRISGGISILEFLEKKNCIFLVATHDLEITSILGNKVDNFSFEGKIIKDDILFDYKLKHNIAKTTNALELLKLFKFNSGITNTMEKRVTTFKKSGIWS